MNNGFDFGGESPHGFNFSFSGFGQTKTADSEEELKTEAKRAHRRTVACTVLSKQYQYRRAFSEVSLLEAMKYERLQMGCTYNFITGGDVDMLSYLKLVLDQYDLDYMLCSTWCMAAEDVLQMQEWWKSGKIKKIDMYVGEIFPNSYKIEWQMVHDFYKEHPEAGRVAVFRNHSKIFAGCSNDEGFYFGIQTSANINTNPRTEQGSITCDKGIYDFYKDYFDGIISFVKE